MLLLVGLGNPGSEYKDTRHNMGFIAVDEIIHRYNFSAPRAKFKGELYEGKVGTKKVLILKPVTYMNLSGESVREAVNFYKIPLGEVVVAYDEMDLLPGKIRMKIGGSAGGHNGIKSIDSHIGKDYRRLRIGIGRPSGKSTSTDYVLNKISGAEKPVVDKVITAIAENFPLIAKGEDEKFMSKFALFMNPPEKSEPKKEENA